MREGVATCGNPTVAVPMPAFFLPHCPVEHQEGSYAHMAKGCECDVPPIGKRAFSISFEHGGIVWIATVGKNLRGRKSILVKHKETGRWRDIHDTALVLAIFPGEPYCVVTYPGSNSHFRGMRIYAIPTGVALFAE
jgi:hypothetical protein